MCLGVYSRLYFDKKSIETQLKGKDTMRYLIPILIFLIFSLNTKASTDTEKIYDQILQQNHNSWIKAAVTAATKNCEPEHLLEILDLEDILLSQFLAKKEEVLRTPDDWKKHTIATFLSFYSMRKTALNAAWNASRDTGGKAASNAAKEAAMHQAKNVLGETAWNISKEILLNQSWAGNTENAINEAWNRARNMSLSITDQAAFKNTSCEIIRGRLAYRVAETESWISVLNPKREVFEKAYQAAYEQSEHLANQSLHK